MVTVTRLDLLMIHWIQWVQWISFRKKSIEFFITTSWQSIGPWSWNQARRFFGPRKFVTALAGEGRYSSHSAETVHPTLTVFTTRVKSKFNTQFAVCIEQHWTLYCKRNLAFNYDSLQMNFGARQCFYKCLSFCSQIGRDVYPSMHLGMGCLYPSMYPAMGYVSQYVPGQEGCVDTPYHTHTLGHTHTPEMANELAVCILLEYILVFSYLPTEDLTRISYSICIHSSRHLSDLSDFFQDFKHQIHFFL